MSFTVGTRGPGVGNQQNQQILKEQPQGKRTDLTNEDIKSIAKELQKCIISAPGITEQKRQFDERRANLLEQKAKADAELTKIDADILAADANILAADEKILAADARIEKNKERLAAAEKKEAELAKRREEIANEKAEIAKNRAKAAAMKTEAREGKLQIICKVFYSIFPNAKSFSVENFDQIFKKYLLDQSIIADTTEGVKFKIISMNSIISFLTEYKDTKACDFRGFRNEINDVKSLVDYLSGPTNVKAIALSKSVSEETKALFQNLASSKKGTLKIQYFD